MPPRPSSDPRAVYRESKDARSALAAARLRLAADAREPLDRVWSIGEDYLYSEHWRNRDRDTSRFLSPIRPHQTRRRVTYNHIKPTVETLVSKMMADRRRMEVRPAENDPELVPRAIGTASLIDDLKDTLNIDEEREASYRLGVLFANAPIWFDWNPAAGAWRTGPAGDRLRDGDIWIATGAPQELYPDPYSTRVDARGGDASYLFRRRLIHRDRVDSWHGAATDEARVGGVAISQIEGAATDTYRRGGPERNAEDAVEYVQYYEAPGGPCDGAAGEKGHGYYQIRTSETVLYEGPLPLIEEGIVYPVEVGQWMKNPRWFWAAGIMEDMVELNELLDQSITQIVAYEKKMLWGRIYVTEGTKVNGRLTTEHGEIFFHPPGQPPKSEYPEPLPLAAYQNVDRYVQFMNEISGVREVSRGEAPERIDTALGLQVVPPADDRRIAVLSNRMSRTWSRVWQNALRVCSKRYTFPRVLRAVGNSYPTRAATVKGEDIDPDRLDIREVEDERLPDNPTTRLALLMQMTSTRMMDPQEARRLARIPSSETEMFDEEQLDREEAQGEAMSILRDGKDFEVHPLQNHLVHVQEKRIFWKSGLGKGAPPAFRQMLERNIIEHQAMMNESGIVPMPPEETGQPNTRGGRGAGDAPRNGAFGDIQAAGGSAVTAEGAS